MRVGIALVRVEGNLWQDASLHRIMALGWQCSTLPETTMLRWSGHERQAILASSTILTSQLKRRLLVSFV